VKKEHFQDQVKRLMGVFGEKYYPPERSAMFWKSYSHLRDETFQEVVNLLIATQRSAPMLDDFERCLTEVKKSEQRRFREIADKQASGGYVSMLQNKANAETDPQRRAFAKRCVQHLMDKLNGKISGPQFYQGCNYLDDVAKQLNPGDKL
jgi:hypothetical protein